MTGEILVTKYPKIFALLDEDIDEVRYLLVVDENFNDEDSDEFDAVDPEDYNYLVYVTERLQALLGEERLLALVKRLDTHASIDLLYIVEVDLYGMQTDLTQEEIERMILDLIEDAL